MGNNPKRNITFRPIYFAFAPAEGKATSTSILHEDELEALYLADFKGLYHEACAESLGVSRPTFAKLLKSGRKKNIEMLMFGKALQIEHHPHNFVMAFPTNDRITLGEHFLIARYFALATISETSVVSLRFINNPIYEELCVKNQPIVDDESAKGLAAGHLIPPLLKEASLLVVRTLGDGIRRNIEGMGIAITLSQASHIDDIIMTLDA